MGLAGTVGVSAFFNTGKSLVIYLFAYAAVHGVLPSYSNVKLYLALKSLPYWRANSVSYDNWKDTAKALVSFSTSIAGTLTGKNDSK